MRYGRKKKRDVGNTAFMYASREGHDDTANVPVGHGARHDIKNLSGYLGSLRI